MNPLLPWLITSTPTRSSLDDNNNINECPWSYIPQRTQRSDNYPYVSGPLFFLLTHHLRWHWKYIRISRIYFLFIVAVSRAVRLPLTTRATSSSKDWAIILLARHIKHCQSITCFFSFWLTQRHRDKEMHSWLWAQRRLRLKNNTEDPAMYSLHELFKAKPNSVNSI